jgi:hypothetical protein
MKIRNRIMLKEEYKESPLYAINVKLKAIAKRVQAWFQTGEFSSDEVILVHLEVSDIDKDLVSKITTRFEDDVHLYHGFLAVSSEDIYKNDEVSYKFILKMYNKETAELINTVEKDVIDSDFSSEFLLNTIVEVQDVLKTIEQPEPESEPDLELEDPLMTGEDPAETGDNDLTGAGDDLDSESTEEIEDPLGLEEEEAEEEEEEEPQL